MHIHSHTYSHAHASTQARTHARMQARALTNALTSTRTRTSTHARTHAHRDAQAWCAHKTHTRVHTHKAQVPFSKVTCQPVPLIVLALRTSPLHRWTRLPIQRWLEFHVVFSFPSRHQQSFLHHRRIWPIMILIFRVLSSYTWVPTDRVWPHRKFHLAKYILKWCFVDMSRVELILPVLFSNVYFKSPFHLNSDLVVNTGKGCTKLTRRPERNNDCVMWFAINLMHEKHTPKSNHADSTLTHHNTMYHNGVLCLLGEMIVICMVK
jgi:hypothetical protein